MSMVGTRHMLGLTIDDGGVVATELRIRSGQAQIRRTGEFLWEQELSDDNTTALGQQLRRFLREHGFSSKRAVIGLPAKWVLAREIEAPPAGADALAGMLSIQAERAFSLHAGELIFDYCGKVNPSQKSPILLLAARRQIVEQVRDLAGAAGLRVQSITVSALACSRASSEGGSADHYGLYTRPTYCEFWHQVEGVPRFIKHIPMARDGSSTDYVDLLSSTVERLILLSSGLKEAPPYQITAYDGCGLSDELAERLNERLGPHATVCDGHAGMRSRGLLPAEEPQEARSIAAAAVAMTAGTDRTLADFLNPRVGIKKTAGHRRAIGWAVFVAAACLVALAALLFDWQRDKSYIATYSQQLKQMSGDIAAAREVVDRVSYAGSWVSREPRFLDCLHELTLAFPEEPRIWATSLALNENGTGSVVGKAVSETSFYEVLDKIKQNKAFSDVQMIHVRDAGRDSREKEFAISFKFQGVK